MPSSLQLLLRSACAVGLALSLTGTLTIAEPAKVIELKPMTVQGAFVGKKKKRAAVDLSGLSCLPPVDGRTACIAVNDENAAAQLVAIDGDKLVPGPTVPLIGSAPDPGTLGTAPVVKCGAGNGEYGEFDGEAVSFTKPYFYVIGSHGCSRKSDEFRVSSFVLARVKVDDAGRPLAGAETTYRVSDVLGKEAEVGLSFGKKLEGASGLNVEGMIADGNRIWLGLRAPLDAQGRAVLLEASASELFKVDHEPGAAVVNSLRISTNGLGIRDLALLPDGRMLVLAGAPNGPEVPFRVFVFDAATSTTTEAGILPSVTGTVKGEKKTGKAEAIALLKAEGKQLRILVMFDGLEDGAPHSATLLID